MLMRLVLQSFLGLVLALSTAQAQEASLCSHSIMTPIERVGYSHPLFPIIENIVRRRYNLTVLGTQDVASRGRRGILFVMNHPSFSDPVLTTIALQEFQPAPIMSMAVANQPGLGPVIRYATDKINTMYVPKGDTGIKREQRKAMLEALLQDIAERLERGENVILWPAGELMESDRSVLGNNRMLADIIEAAPNARIVLGRTSGLWGSSFGGVAAHKLDMGRAALNAGIAIGSSFLPGETPRRDVGIELFEPNDLPRDGGRAAINEYVENWYNEIEQPLIRVPYSQFGR